MGDLKNTERILPQLGLQKYVALLEILNIQGQFSVLLS
jgi:hypothetical protein